MFSFIYHTIIFQPMYNGLVSLINIVPWADAGLAIIIFTLIVKLILFPLSKKSVQTQLSMKKYQPELDTLKEKYKNDKQEQARQTMQFYKEKGIRPFAGVLLLFIQLPIIIALYRVFLTPGLPTINITLLYSFVHAPAFVNVHFLNILDISHKNIWLALLAGISTFFQVRFSMPAQPPRAPLAPGAKPSFQDDFARSMSVQMKYIFPVLAFFISWSISGAIALYWITSNLFTIGQELVIRRSFKRSEK